MKNLSRNEGLAVAAGLALMVYLFFSEPLMNLFNPQVNNQNTNMIESGFKTEEVSVGQGNLAEPGDTLTVHYVGRLPNGQVFDSSLDRNTPITFVLGSGQVIRGWDEGLQGMRVGGKRVITIAPDYGYGARAVGAIPANSILIFEVELVDIEKAAR
ncbi:MAG: FKBP-type peptidyl-prolyl cis-trans isomerase [bacterium]|nr:FKBP-type peptidyl-prolyl cis-trans isomerase [bacterium]